MTPETPKAEARSPREGRMTNTEKQRAACMVIRAWALIRHFSFVIRHSDFDLRISFGFLPSGFGLHTNCA